MLNIFCVSTGWLHRNSRIALGALTIPISQIRKLRRRELMRGPLVTLARAVIGRWPRVRTLACESPADAQACLFGCSGLIVSRSARSLTENKGVEKFWRTSLTRVTTGTLVNGLSQENGFQRTDTGAAPYRRPLPWNFLPLPTFKPPDRMRGQDHPAIWMPLFFLLFTMCSLPPAPS